MTNIDMVNLGTKRPHTSLETGQFSCSIPQNFNKLKDTESHRLDQTQDHPKAHC